MRLKELRKAANMTQSDLAKKLGISQNTYSYWENGRTKIDNLSLEKLANIFNVTVGYLIGTEETSAQQEVRTEITSWLEYYKDDKEAIDTINEMLMILPQLNKESTSRLKAYLSDIFSNPKNLKGAEIEDETEAQKGDTYESR